MTREKNGQPLFSDFIAKQRKNLLRAFGIHAIGRFVQNQKSWPAQHGPANAQALPHAGRINPYPVVLPLRESDLLKDFVNVAGGNITEQTGGEFEIFSARK